MPVGRNPPYSPSKRATIAEAALSQPYRKVAERFGCSISTVSRLVKNAATRGTQRSIKPPGRPPSIDRRTLSRIRRTFRAHRFLQPRFVLHLLQLSGITLSLSSLRRLMKKFGLKRRVARTKPWLSKVAKFKRRQYALARKGESIWDHRRTIYTDEAAVRMNGSIKRWVTREVGEAYLAECMVARMLSQKKTVMVWAAVWHGGRTELHQFDTSASAGKRKGVTAIIYRDQITKGPLKDAWRRVNNRYRAYGGARIVEDNAKIHTSPINRQQGGKQRFFYLPHPPSSPDLNPIENCWAWMKAKMAMRPRRPTTAEELFEVAQEVWNGMPQSVIDNCIDSMERRLRDVRRNAGSVTKY